MRSAISAVVLAACAAPAPVPPARAQDALGAEALRRDVEVLSAPATEGRGVGTQGIEVAADHVARAFAEAGLRPAGDSGGWTQAFEVPAGVTLGAPVALADLEAGSDFLPFGFSEDGETTAPVVFAGYGITAPELNWDDYAGLDVRGALVIAFAHEPGEKDPKSPFRAPQAFRYREARYKAMNAREHGAAGLLLVREPSAHAGEPDRLTALRGASGAAGAGLFAVQVTEAGAARLLSKMGAPALGDLEPIASEKRGGRALGGPVRLAVSLVRTRQVARNVVGILPGRDPALAHEALVIGAHYDHLGYGGESSLSPDQTDTIHPGADDNASGTAGLLALARALGAEGTRRTVMFAAFSAEEMGLIGSSAFMKAPPWPVESMVAMINMDMIGRPVGGRVLVQGADTATDFRSLLERAAAGLPLTLAPGGDGYGPSDHTSFWSRRVPVLFFFTGAHADYHRPTDTAEKLDYAGMAEVLRLVHRVARALADGPRPVPASAPPPPPSAGHRDFGGGGYGPYLGSIPDFAERTEPGVLLTGVRADSPAQKAGLAAGDVIVRLGGKEIRNLYDLTYALREHRPGDVVEIEYERKGERRKTKATLGVRP